MSMRWMSVVAFATAVVASLALSMVATAETLWIPASQAKSLSGPIVLGAKAGVVEEGALGDFLVSTVCVTPDRLQGYAEYEVTIPKTAAYTVWVRLRCPQGLEESFALIPAGEPPTGDASRCVGGSGVGVRGWHWDSQGQGPESSPGSGRLRLEIPAGTWKFRLYPRQASATVFRPASWAMARPMFNPRLNLLCLTTDPAYVPTDADARKTLGVEETHLDAAKLRQASPQLPAVSPEDLRRQGKRPIPDWLRCPRLFTKDSWQYELKTRQAGDIAFMVRQLAANEASAFRLSVYWGGDAYYQSRVTPHAAGLGSLDYLREATDEGNRLGVKIVAYINPNALYRWHPLFEDVAIRRADGSRPTTVAYNVADSCYVCINHPRYRAMLVDLLKEIFTQYGPAGLYVDGLTPHRCFCEHCRKKYREMWGQEMPVAKLDTGRQWCVLWEMVNRPELVGDPNDPDTSRYTQFLYESLTEATRLIAETVRQAKPDAAVLFHSWPKPAMAADYDGTLTEVYLRHPWQHTLWKFGELANYSNIFSVPALFNIYLHDYGTEAEARTKMVQGLANGCYPNFWNVLGMKRMFHFMRENAESLDFLTTSPVKFLALPRGVNEDTAQQRVKADRSVPRPVHDRFLGCSVGMYSALVRQGLPIVSMQRGDFHMQLAGFRVLCLANEACMSDEQVERVREFVNHGGGLIATHETSLYDEKGQRRADFGLADVFGVHYAQMLPAANRKIRWTPSPVTDGLEPLMHDDTHVAARLTTATSVATLVGETVDGQPVPAAVIQPYGRGRVVYLPGRLEAIQCQQLSPTIERLLAAAVRYVADRKLPVELHATAPVAATLFDQPTRRVVHLVNLNGDSQYKSDEVRPIENVAVRLEIPAGRQVKEIRRLWDKRPVALTVTDGTIRTTLDTLGDYEALAIEWQTP